MTNEPQTPANPALKRAEEAERLAEGMYTNEEMEAKDILVALVSDLRAALEREKRLREALGRIQEEDTQVVLAGARSRRLTIGKFGLIARAALEGKG